MAARIFSIKAGVARGPRIVVAGSPGTMCTNKDKKITINSKTMTVIRMRLTMYTDT